MWKTYTKFLFPFGVHCKEHQQSLRVRIDCKENILLPFNNLSNIYPHTDLVTIIPL